MAGFDPLRVLGVDPGLQITGYGVISVSKEFPGRGALELIEAGVVRTHAKEGISARLKRVHEALSDVITELKPDVLVIEKLFAHYKHPATAILMGHVRGVVCLLSTQHCVPLVSIPSTHVKKSITGNGHAKKIQIQRMIQHTLSLKTMPEPPDVADAIAIAISHAFNARSHQTGSRVRILKAAK